MNPDILLSRLQRISSYLDKTDKPSLSYVGSQLNYLVSSVSTRTASEILNTYISLITKDAYERMLNDNLGYIPEHLSWNNSPDKNVYEKYSRIIISDHVTSENQKKASPDRFDAMDVDHTLRIKEYMRPVKSTTQETKRLVFDPKEFSKVPDSINKKWFASFMNGVLSSKHFTDYLRIMNRPALESNLSKIKDSEILKLMSLVYTKSFQLFNEVVLSRMAREGLETDFQMAPMSYLSAGGVDTWKKLINLLVSDPDSEVSYIDPSLLDAFKKEGTRNYIDNNASSILNDFKTRLEQLPEVVKIHDKIFSML